VGREAAAEQDSSVSPMNVPAKATAKVSQSANTRWCVKKPPRIAALSPSMAQPRKTAISPYLGISQ
jgi:hypothetical protein